MQGSRENVNRVAEEKPPAKGYGLSHLLIRPSGFLVFALVIHERIARFLVCYRRIFQLLRFIAEETAKTAAYRTTGKLVGFLELFLWIGHCRVGNGICRAELWNKMLRRVTELENV